MAEYFKLPEKKTFDTIPLKPVVKVLPDSFGYSGLVTAYKLPDGTEIIILGADFEALMRATTHINAGRSANLNKQKCRRATLVLTEKVVMRQIEPDDEEL